MKNFLSLKNIEFKSSSSINSFISSSSELNNYSITNILQEDSNLWLSEEFLPQEIILNFGNIKLKEHPKKLVAIGIHCLNKYPTNPKIIEVLVSHDNSQNFISLGHFDLSFKAGRQLIYLDEENDDELQEILNSINFDNLILKLIIKETFGEKSTYINNLYLYDNIDTNNINFKENEISNNNINENTNKEQDKILVQIYSDKEEKEENQRYLSDIEEKSLVENRSDIKNIKEYFNDRVKTPKIHKKFNQHLDNDDFNDISNKNINKKERNNKKKIMGSSNININNQLNNLIKDFNAYKESQKEIMNNYEMRINLIEKSCSELKNNLRKIHATLNTIIDSQYNQNQASNEYYRRECQNMVNEAIVNILCNFGRNYGPYPQPPKVNQNIHQNYFNNMNNLGKTNNIFTNEDNYNDNDNDINREEEMMEQEIDNLSEALQYNNINNNINNNIDNNIKNNKMNNSNDEKIDRRIELDDLDNIDISPKLNENNDVNDDYNESLIPYDDGIKLHSKKNGKNLFAKSSQNFRINNTNTKGNNSDNQKSIKNKRKKELSKKKNQNKITLTEPNVKKITKNKKLKKVDDVRIKMEDLKEDLNKILNNVNNNNEGNNNEGNNNELSDNSIDDIRINTEINENSLKNTLEKFEKYMSFNNNFGKSQSVYSNNVLNAKKEIFGDNKFQNKNDIEYKFDNKINQKNG